MNDNVDLQEAKHYWRMLYQDATNETSYGKKANELNVLNYLCQI